MTFSRGDVVVVDFTYSDQIRYKRRPALVVQDIKIQTGLPQTVLAMITSNLSRRGLGRVLFRQHSYAGRSMGLLADSVVMTDNLITALNSDIDSVIGYCPAMHLVDDALRITLGL